MTLVNGGGDPGQGPIGADFQETLHSVAVVECDYPSRRQNNPLEFTASGYRQILILWTMAEELEIVSTFGFHGGDMSSINEPAPKIARRVVGATLCLTVSVIHTGDQGGLPGSESPAYLGVCYYVLELVGVVAAILIFTGTERIGWFLAIGVAAGPLIGYMLSRGPGLPGDDDDRGRWTEPLGIVSLVVEGPLLVLALTSFVTLVRHESWGSPGKHRPHVTRSHSIVDHRSAPATDESGRESVRTSCAPAVEGSLPAAESRWLPGPAARPRSRSRPGR